MNNETQRERVLKQARVCNSIKCNGKITDHREVQHLSTERSVIRWWECLECGMRAIRESQREPM